MRRPSTAAVDYATTTGSSLQFHNLCALLKVTNGKNVSVNINISSNFEPLAGTFKLNTSTGELICTSQKQDLCVNSVPNGKTIYIAIAPGTYKKFWAGWEIEGVNYVEKSKSNVTFEAGKIYDLGNTSDWN